MNEESFYRLCGIVEPYMQLQDWFMPPQGSIPACTICMYMTIRWIAGGRYLDIIAGIKMDNNTLYYIVWNTIGAINICPHLMLPGIPTSDADCIELSHGFTGISSESIIVECVGAVDSY
jgi:hypothetical protein